MSDSINQLINDEAVCRTAPATPGLSIIGWNQSLKGGISHLDGGISYYKDGISQYRVESVI